MLELTASKVADSVAFDHVGDAELWGRTLAAGEQLRRVFDQWAKETVEHAGPD